MAEDRFDVAAEFKDLASSGLERFGLSLEKVVKVGLEPLAKIAPTAARMIENLITSAGPTALAVGALGGAAVAAVAGLAALAKQTAETSVELERMSTRTGVSVEDLNALRIAVDELGVGLGEIGASFKFMQVNLNEAASGGNRQVEMLQKLGVNVAEIVRMQPAEQFETMARAVSSIESPMEKVNAAVTFFGRQGASMLPALEKVAENGFGGLRQNAEELGNVIDEQLAAQSREFMGILDDIGDIVEGVANQMGAELMPAFIEIAEQVLAAGKAFIEFERETHVLQITMQTLAGLLTIIATAMSILIPRANSSADATDDFTGSVESSRGSVVAAGKDLESTSQRFKEFGDAGEDAGDRAAMAIHGVAEEIENLANAAPSHFATVEEAVEHMTDDAKQRAMDALQALKGFLLGGLAGLLTAGPLGGAAGALIGSVAFTKVGPKVTPEERTPPAPIEAPVEVVKVPLNEKQKQFIDDLTKASIQASGARAEAELTAQRQTLAAAEVSTATKISLINIEAKAKADQIEKMLAAHPEEQARALADAEKNRIDQIAAAEASLAAKRIDLIKDVKDAAIDASQARLQAELSAAGTREQVIQAQLEKELIAIRRALEERLKAVKGDPEGETAARAAAADQEAAAYIKAQEAMKEAAVDRMNAIKSAEGAAHQAQQDRIAAGLQAAGQLVEAEKVRIDATVASYDRDLQAFIATTRAKVKDQEEANALIEAKTLETEEKVAAAREESARKSRDLAIQEAQERIDNVSRVAEAEADIGEAYEKTASVAMDAEARVLAARLNSEGKTQDAQRVTIEARMKAIERELEAEARRTQVALERIERERQLAEIKLATATNDKERADAEAELVELSAKKVEAEQNYEQAAINSAAALEEQRIKLDDIGRQQANNVKEAENRARQEQAVANALEAQFAAYRQGRSVAGSLRDQLRDLQRQMRDVGGGGFGAPGSGTGVDPQRQRLEGDLKQMSEQDRQLAYQMELANYEAKYARDENAKARAEERAAQIERQQIELRYQEEQKQIQLQQLEEMERQRQEQEQRRQQIESILGAIDKVRDAMRANAQATFQAVMAAQHAAFTGSGKISDRPGFAAGGEIGGGAPGSPVAITAHVGEAVVPRDLVPHLRRVLTEEGGSGHYQSGGLVRRGMSMGDTYIDNRTNVAQVIYAAPPPDYAERARQDADQAQRVARQLYDLERHGRRAS